VQVIASAVSSGASTRTAVRDAIAATDIEGIGGRIRFDSDGDRIDAPVSLWTIREGRMEPLGEAPQAPHPRRPSGAFGATSP